MGSSQLVSQDVLIDLERDIAKHLWMLREFQSIIAVQPTNR